MSTNNLNDLFGGDIDTVIKGSIGKSATTDYDERLNELPPLADEIYQKAMVMFKNVLELSSDDAHTKNGELVKRYSPNRFAATGYIFEGFIRYLYSISSSKMGLREATFSIDYSGYKHSVSFAKVNFLEYVMEQGTGNLSEISIIDSLEVNDYVTNSVKTINPFKEFIVTIGAYKMLSDANMLMYLAQRMNNDGEHIFAKKFIQEFMFKRNSEDKSQSWGTQIQTIATMKELISLILDNGAGFTIRQSGTITSKLTELPRVFEGDMDEFPISIMGLSMACSISHELVNIIQSFDGDQRLSWITQANRLNSDIRAECIKKYFTGSGLKTFDQLKEDVIIAE